MATIGTGVGLGKIEYSSPLIPGSVVLLPKIPVVNTGEEASNYVVKVDYFGDQTEFKPPVEWFSISPNNLNLDPGKSKEVSIYLKLPLTPLPGKYMALLEAQNIGSENGQLTLGPAAATKLYFTVGKSPGILGAATQRIKTLSFYYPFWMLILAGFFILEALNITRKHFKIKISTKS